MLHFATDLQSWSMENSNALEGKIHLGSWNEDGRPKTEAGGQNLKNGVKCLTQTVRGNPVP